MKQKDLKLDFRYLCDNIACLSIDSLNGKPVHNDIDNEEAIIIFNSLVGESEDCQTVKKILQENQQLKEQLEASEKARKEAMDYIKENPLYEEEYDYDYEENIYMSGIDDEYSRKILLGILEIDKGE